MAAILTNSCHSVKTATASLQILLKNSQNIGHIGLKDQIMNGDFVALNRGHWGYAVHCGTVV